MQPTVGFYNLFNFANFDSGHGAEWIVEGSRGADQRDNSHWTQRGPRPGWNRCLRARCTLAAGVRAAAHILKLAIYHSDLSVRRLVLAVWQ